MENKNNNSNVENNEFEKLNDDAQFENEIDINTINEQDFECFQDGNCENKKSNKKKAIILGGCTLALGVGVLTFANTVENNVNDEFHNFTINDSGKVGLEFTIKDENTSRNRTSQEMREFYTPEGEEFIKAIYPDSSDSDLALVTVGKSTQKELSNIEFTTTNNEKISLKKLKGKRVILDFALTDCPSCQEESTYLSSNKVGEDDIFIHVFPRSTTEEIKATYKDLNINFDSEYTVSSTGMNGLTFEDFNITHVPTKLYINEDGIVTYITTNSLIDKEVYDLHYNKAFDDNKKMLDFLKEK